MFTYPFKIGKFLELTIWHLLLFLACFILSKLAKKYVKKYILQQQKNKQFTIIGREITLVALSRQLISIFFIVLAILIFAASNGFSNFQQFLDEPVFYNSKTIKLTVSNLFTVVFLFFVAKLINILLRLYLQRNIFTKQGFDKSKEYTIVVISKFIIYTFFILYGLQTLGVNINLLIASSAALFVGLGLGIQRIFGDLVSGFILLFEGSVKVGDIVEVENLTARVEEVNLRTSKVTTRDGNVIIIPNSKLTHEYVNNWSYNTGSTRYNIKIHIGYDTDLEKAKTILYNCALDHKWVDKKKQIIVFLENFGDSALHLTLYFWTDKAWEIPLIQSDIRFAIEKAFKENNIRIPFPQRELTILNDGERNTE